MKPLLLGRSAQREVLHVPPVSWLGELIGCGCGCGHGIGRHSSHGCERCPCRYDPPMVLRFATQSARLECAAQASGNVQEKWRRGDSNS